MIRVRTPAQLLILSRLHLDSGHQTPKLLVKDTRYFTENFRPRGVPRRRWRGWK